MPRTRPLGPPPDERPNWHRLNEGQRRYAWEQYNLAKVRRGIDINHPIPGNQQEEAQQEPVQQVDPLADLDGVLAAPRDENQVSEVVNELMGSLGEAGASTVNEPPKKKQKTSKMTGSLPGTAGGQGSGTALDGNESIMPVERPLYSPHHQIRHYKKVHRFLTFGLAYKPVSISHTTPAYSDVFMVTSMAEIPWDRVFMYLNPSEYALLPRGSMVKHVSCSVKAENVRIAFPVNATDSGLATLNQNKFLRVGKGLLQKVQCVNVKPTAFNATQPMITTSVSLMDEDDVTAYKSYVDNFYGVPNNDISEPDLFLSQTPRHQFGIPWVLQYYCAPVTQTIDPNNSGWEDFQCNLSEMSTEGPAGNICRMEYSPKNGLLKDSLSAIYTGYPSLGTGSNSIVINSGAGNSQSRTSTVTITGGVVTGVKETFKDWVQSAGATIYSRFEKNQTKCSGLFNEYTAHTQPSLHVGVMPVPALTTSAINNELTNSTFTDSQAYFEVTCEMTVECKFPTYRPLATFPNTNDTDIILSDSAALANSRTMYHGMYQKL